MPAQKLSLAESLDDEEASQVYHQRHAKRSPELRGEEQREEEDELEEMEDQGRDGEETGQQDSENSVGSLSGSEETPEYLFVELPEIRKEVQCPICLGIIKKTRTVMECLHRFCRECIDKSMRIGNNECPACRTHCASRRSLRDDPNYDSLIAAFYPDIEKYEKEELEFREEEKNRNQQIQASIAIAVQRQSEALVKKRNKDKSVGTPLTRSQRNHRNFRRQNQGIFLQDNEEENDHRRENNSSSSDELCIELRRSKRKRGTRVRPYQPSSSMASPDRMESEVSNPRNLTWGRGGFRSHTRHGGGSSSNSKSSGNNRLSKLVDYLQSLDENTNEFNIHLVLVSLDKQSTPSLQQPHLCCQPTLSVKHLCEYVAEQTPLAAEEVEIFVVKGGFSTSRDNMAGEDSTSIYELTTLVVDPSKDDLEILLEDETVAGLRSKCISKRKYLILAYRRKDNMT